MNKETLTALKGSIKKWERIEAGVGFDRQERNCPLCKIYFKNTCWLCPVFKKTRHISCCDSPYTKWTKHLSDKHNIGYRITKRILCPTCKRLAGKELRFLKSLLPKEIKEAKK